MNKTARQLITFIIETRLKLECVSVTLGQSEVADWRGFWQDFQAHPLRFLSNTKKKQTVNEVFWSFYGQILSSHLWTFSCQFSNSRESHDEVANEWIFDANVDRRSCTSSTSLSAKADDSHLNSVANNWRARIAITAVASINNFRAKHSRSDVTSPKIVAVVMVVNVLGDLTEILGDLIAVVSSPPRNCDWRTTEANSAAWFHANWS